MAIARLRNKRTGKAHDGLSDSYVRIFPKEWEYADAQEKPAESGAADPITDLPKGEESVPANSGQAPSQAAAGGKVKKGA